VNKLMVIFQTIHRRSIQLVDLKGRRGRRWCEMKRERGCRVPQPSGLKAQ
jgi:hypothetical protein